MKAKSLWRSVGTGISDLRHDNMGLLQPGSSSEYGASIWFLWCVSFRTLSSPPLEENPMKAKSLWRSVGTGISDLRHDNMGLLQPGSSSEYGASIWFLWCVSFRI
ncbi:uncharacterized protein [Triticum aestivum]|uniref:uncharacterized protein n=1 Tax=Triticum aestivum TaxID=4565 RepID=UPI001D01A2C6|nr:uncharacterized protein LOC123157922 [Triticum aestivum]